ncbi:MAG TPA: hypothetical protein VGB77_19650 [Abditibacteriaceae bacterium]|jgi:hypothetical protein
MVAKTVTSLLVGIASLSAAGLVESVFSYPRRVMLQGIDCYTPFVGIDALNFQLWIILTLACSTSWFLFQAGAKWHAGLALILTSACVFWTLLFGGTRNSRADFSDLVFAWFNDREVAGYDSAFQACLGDAFAWHGTPIVWALLLFYVGCKLIRHSHRKKGKENTTLLLMHSLVLQ